MNQQNLERIITQYISNYTAINAPESEGGRDEGYKWRVIDSFQRSWDIDARDFFAMFSKAMDDISKENILNNQVLPLKGLFDLMEQFGEVDFVRNQFRMLYSDDEGDLDVRGRRVFEFRDNVNAKIEEHYPGSWKYKQSTFSTVFLLSLWKPADNYIYRYTEAFEWANCIEYADDFGSGDDFSLRKYYKMMDELREALPDYPELIKLHKKHMEEGEFCFDDDMHILAFDILFCAKDLGFYRECPALNVSTKERIRIAKAKEERDNAILEYQRIIEEINNLELDKQTIPDLVGFGVTHKKYGNGVIVKADNGRYTVSFKDREVKFNADSISNGYITFSDDGIKELFEHNYDIAQKIKQLGYKADELRRKYDLA